MTHLDLNEGPEQKLVGIDMSRIVTYPGFNAPRKFYFYSWHWSLKSYSFKWLILDARFNLQVDNFTTYKKLT